MDQTLTLHWQERRLGRTLLRTYRDTIDLYDVFPNEKQPRMGPKEDPELQRQIEANEGIFEPLLLEPHPEDRNKFRIIDGDRRWTNSKILVEVQKKDQYKHLPAEITDRTLTDEERLRVWIYIHRQRREWDTKEKEMVAYSLVNMVDSHEGRPGGDSQAGRNGKIDKRAQEGSFEITEWQMPYSIPGRDPRREGLANGVATGTSSEDKDSATQVSRATAILDRHAQSSERAAAKP